MFGGLGPWEIGIIAFIILLLFGAKRLPEMGKSLGTGIREFKKSITSPAEEEEKETEAKTSGKIEEEKEAEKV